MCFVVRCNNTFVLIGAHVYKRGYDDMNRWIGMSGCLGTYEGL